MQRLLGVAMFLYAVAIGGLPLLTSHAQLWFLAFLVGLSGGMVTVIFFAVWGRAFGRLHLGRIQGAAQMMTVLASAIGPLIFAQSQRLTGSYLAALWILAPCTLLVSVAPRAALIAGASGFAVSIVIAYVLVLLRRSRARAGASTANQRALGDAVKV